MGGLPPGQVKVFLACLLISGCSWAGPQNDVHDEGRRLAPLPSVSCDRNQLTSWFGVVSGYRTDTGQTWLQITTDYDTVEAVTLKHPEQSDAAGFYRLWGEPFQKSDWSVIEQTSGTLVTGMRATAWICEDEQTPPLIDWQPPRD